MCPDAVRPASIHIENGRIVRIEGWSASLAGERTDFGDLVVSPGLVDTHVHVNEPGRTEWEGFDTATRAAAAGGVTTIVDMPLNSVPATTTATALVAKRAAARGRCHVDVAFWGGVVPGNARDLDPLVDAGVRGFKCFLVPSGVDEFPAVAEADLREAMPVLARRGVPLLVHAEAPDVLGDFGLRIADGNPLPVPQPAIRNPQRYATYLATRPPEAEVAAIQLMVRLAREFGVHVHIVHVACAEAVAEIARAKAEGVRITAETCPHYLTFAAEEIPDGATEFKCAPPIREAPHREALWAGLRSGTLDLIATDHSPALPAMKCRGDFTKAWGGIASLELSLAAVWTGMEDRVPIREHPHAIAPTFVPWDMSSRIAHVTRVMSTMPAWLAGIGDRKGMIAPGYDADFVIWNPDAQWTVQASRLQQRHKLTPYAGRALRGVVRATYLRGDRVWTDGRLTRASSGQLL